MTDSNDPSPESVEMGLAWAVYSEHQASLEKMMKALPPGQLADRYHQTLTKALERMRPDRSALQGLFGRAMTDGSDFDLMGGPQARQLSQAYHRLVLYSDDVLQEPKARELGIALYTFHMLVVVFWLYDRSPGQASTGKLVRLVHELFKLIRPMFFLPMIPQGIARLAEIVLPDLGDSSVGAAAQDDPRDGQHQDFDIHRD